MYRPDPVIVRKIQEFDRHLFVLWNHRKQYFEIWRHEVIGRKLITPVVRSLYEPGAPRTYAPLDERILACLYQPWGSGNHLEWFDKQAERQALLEIQREKSRRDNWRAFGRDMWQTLNQRFVSTHASKNSGRPNFNKTSPHDNWVRPDVRVSTSSRLFQRSAANARLYGYRSK